MESFEECIMREVREEMGDDIQFKDDPAFLCVTNMRKYAPKHYVDIGMIAVWESGEPVVMEPQKLASWDWHPIDDMPSQLFGCIQNYLDAYRTGQVYFTD